MNIVLIGYRGTGKSSVARLLAERLSRRVVSTDDEVVKRAGLSIPEFVQRFGWDRFRDLEAQVVKDVAAEEDVIVDTGGGAVLRPENVRALKASGTLVWLTAEVPTIAARIGGDTQRPSLTGTKTFVEEIAEVLAQRVPAYRAAADHEVATDTWSAREVTEVILAALGGQKRPGC